MGNYVKEEIGKGNRGRRAAMYNVHRLLFLVLGVEMW